MTAALAPVAEAVAEEADIPPPLEPPAPNDPKEYSAGTECMGCGVAIEDVNAAMKGPGDARLSPAPTDV